MNEYQRVLMVLAWVLAGCSVWISNVSAQQYLVVHDNSRLVFTYPESFFATTQVSCGANARLSIVYPDHRVFQSPYTSKTTTNTENVALADRIDALEKEVIQLAEGGLPAIAELFDDGAAGEVFAMMRAEIVRMETALLEQQQILQQLLTGVFDTPVTKLSSQEASQLATKLALVEIRLNKLNESMPQHSANVPTNTSVVPVTPAVLEIGVSSYLKQDVFLDAQAVILIDKDTTIDAQGHAIIFSSLDVTQLTITAGSSLLLKNVTIKGLKRSSLVIEERGTLVLGENVCIEAIDDVHWVTGTIRVEGSNTIVKLRGVGGCHALRFASFDDAHKAKVILGTNVLALSNIRCCNAECISTNVMASRAAAYVGAVALCGGAYLEACEDLKCGVVVWGGG